MLLRKWGCGINAPQLKSSVYHYCLLGAFYCFKCLFFNDIERLIIQFLFRSNLFILVEVLDKQVWRDNVRLHACDKELVN